ncbi:unnamed protein product, partial [Nesidiocoris tenuis]
VGIWCLKRPELRRTKCALYSASGAYLSDRSYHERRENSNENFSKRRVVGVVGVGASFLLGIYGYRYLKAFSESVSIFVLDDSDDRRQVSSTEELDEEVASYQGIPGGRIDGLPTYKMADVAKHSSAEKRLWVTYKEGVYDITDFVDSHPGGDAILMAVGSALEPFWNLYAVHKTPQVTKLLEQYRIGNLDPAEAKENAEGHDPYHADPSRDPELVPSNKKPFNAEPLPERLIENYITPTEYFYVRNHLPVPVVDLSNYAIEIEGPGIKSTSLTLEELKKMPKHTITATVMCAGNRRSEMSQVKEVKGLYWGPSAIGNATWSGVKLSELLEKIGFDESTNEALHVQFEGLDLTPESNPYGGSIPIEKAVDPKGDVILAYEMNGKPLTRDHGYPVRVIAPGIVGARCVKWLNRIVLSKEESPAFWQRRDYKGFSPNVTAETAKWDEAAAIEELPVISAICMPSKHDHVHVNDDSTVTVRGYAWSGGGRPIIRVDVTSDGGDRWVEAELVEKSDARPGRHWSWTLWEVKVPVTASQNQVELWAKAVDSSYNVQPESFKHIWNIRGVLNNAYHRVPINLVR